MPEKKLAREAFRTAWNLRSGFYDRNPKASLPLVESVGDSCQVQLTPNQMDVLFEALQLFADLNAGEFLALLHTHDPNSEADPKFRKKAEEHLRKAQSYVPPPTPDDYLTYSGKVALKLLNIPLTILGHATDVPEQPLQLP